MPPPLVFRLILFLSVCLLSSVCLCPLCLQTLPSALSSGVRAGRGVEEGEALGDG